MLTFRRMCESDLGGVAALQRACFPEPFPLDLLWNESHLANHVNLFPEGQFVALFEGRIVASCTNMRVSDATWEAHLPWEEVTGGLFLPNHDNAGMTLYGIDISVHPDFRGQGIARRLYGMRFDLVSELKLTRYGTVCRMPDFADSGLRSPESYASQVVAGTKVDRTLTPLLKMGLAFEGVIEEYMDDEESGNAGAILSWQK